MTTVTPSVPGIIARRSLQAGVLIQTPTLQCTIVTPIAKLKVIEIVFVDFYFYESILIILTIFVKLS